MAEVSKDAHLGRESLYKALTPRAKPCFEAVMKVAHALEAAAYRASATSSASTHTCATSNPVCLVIS